jgi:hypothetical protein
VGYVEDEETPQMIMKKFEELESLMAQGKKQEAKPAPLTGKIFSYHISASKTSKKEKC